MAFSDPNLSRWYRLVLVGLMLQVVTFGSLGLISFFRQRIFVAPEGISFDGLRRRDLLYD